MRILLVATNRQDRMNSRMNAQPMPIGLAYIAAHLDHERHQVRVVDLMFADDYLAETESIIKEFRPDVVGISLRNLSNHSYLDTQWALPITRDVIDRIREHSGATVIVGGPAFSLLPKQCFEFLRPDLGVAGDAGETFAEICEAYRDWRAVGIRLAGLGSFQGRRGGAERGALRVGIRHEAAPGRPWRWTSTATPDSASGVLTKLGSFSYPTPASTAGMTEADYRVIRPIDEVVAEVRELWEKYQLRKVFFVDNGFNCPLDHAKSLCSAIIEADLGIRWNTPLASFNCDAELVRLMREAGCALTLLGNRDGSANGGGSREERLEGELEVPRLLEEGGLHYTIARTFGEPGETRESVEYKLDLLRRVNPALANLRVGVSIMPGTGVASLALEEGLISDESELIEPTFYIAPEVKGLDRSLPAGTGGRQPALEPVLGITINHRGRRRIEG